MPWTTPHSRFVAPTVLIPALLCATSALGTGKRLTGQQAPEIAVLTAMNAPKAHLLRDLRGKVVILEFWATWCAPCRASIPHLESLHKELADRDLVVLSMTKEPVSTVKHFIDTQLKDQMTFAVLIDKDGQTNRTYGIRSVPTAYLIDGSGRVAWQGHTSKLTKEHVTDVLRTTAAALLKDAESQDPKVRSMAAFRLGKYQAPGAGATLAGLLKDEDALVRRRTAAGLVACGKAAKPMQSLLREAATDSEAEVRVAALSGLGQIADRESAPLVAAVLKDTESEVRRAAAAALGAIKSPVAIPALVTALHGEDREVSKEAALALAEVGSPLATVLLRTLATNSQFPARVWVAVAVHRLGEPGTPERFKRLLADEEVPIRRQALEALGQLSNCDATDLYISALGDPDSEVRAVAMAALAESGQPRGRDAFSRAVVQRIGQLLPRLSAKDYKERQRASKEVAQLGPAAAPWLLDRIDEVAMQGRGTLGIAIGRLGNPSVIQSATEQLENPDLDGTTRYAYEAILRGMPSEAREAVQHLLSSHEAGARESAAKLLGGYADEDSTKDLRNALQDPTARVRAYAAYYLARRYEPSARPALLALASDADSTIHGLCTNGLGYVRDAKATEAIVALAKGDRSRRYMGIYALQRQDTPESARALGSFLADGDANVRKRARSALERMTTPEAKTLLDGIRTPSARPLPKETREAPPQFLPHKTALSLKVPVYSIVWQGLSWLARTPEGWAYLRQSKGVLSLEPVRLDGDPLRGTPVDVDGDGNMELLVLRGSCVIVCRIDATEASVAGTGPVGEHLEATSKRERRVAAADLDGDGQAEIIYFWSTGTSGRDGDKDGGMVILRQQEADGELAVAAQLKGVVDPSGYMSLYQPSVGDVDGDKRPELVFSNSNGYIWIVRWLNGEYRLEGPHHRHAGGAAHAYTADLDGDNVCELIEGTNGGNVTVRRLSKGFVPETVWSEDLGRLAYGIAFGDLDGDGVTDMAVSHSYTNHYYDRRVSVLSMAKDRQWTVAWHTDTGSGSADRVFIIDVDHDGRNELIVCNPDGRLVVYSHRPLTVGSMFTLQAEG